MLDLEKNYRHAGLGASARPAPAPRSALLDEMALMLSRQVSVYTAVKQAAMAERLDLALDDFRALEMVMECESLATGQLAHMLGISSGGATALINRLEARGLVKRDRHPLDRRIIVIRAVEQQCAAVQAVMDSVSDEIAMQSARYDMAELELVHRFLADCVKAFKHDTRRWLESGTGRQDRGRHG
ncbi:MarR family transcriptional regulator [Orrella sp. JC864]|uniref:MarR family transcriptional regulator n=1 Tax=Orrella sp. JC864 TaxID=3120298 RepID=UPI0012BB6DE5